MLAYDANVSASRMAIDRRRIALLLCGLQVKSRRNRIVNVFRGTSKWPIWRDLSRLYIIFRAPRCDALPFHNGVLVAIRALGTLVLTRHDIRSLLTFDDYITEVERAFRLHAEGSSLPTGLLHADADGGEFHIKSGGLRLPKLYFGLKVNGGFFQNMKRFGMPNIQGSIILCDGENGYPLAFMDSGEITINRTGAATAVA